MMTTVIVFPLTLMWHTQPIASVIREDQDFLHLAQACCMAGFCVCVCVLGQFSSRTNKTGHFFPSIVAKMLKGGLISNGCAYGTSCT
jgi:hypothetical protein